MSNSFYEWEHVSLGFRKLVINPFQTKFITEYEKNFSIEENTKKCKVCKNNLAKIDYFFRITNKTNLDHTCKVCRGGRYAWGIRSVDKLINNKMFYCRSCDTVYPLNDIYFVKNKKTKTGYHSNCKQCSVHKPSFGINRNLNEIVDVKSDHQICLDCNLELPKDNNYFYKLNKNRGLDRYETVCKKCQGADYGIAKYNSIYKKEGLRFCSGCKEFKKKCMFYRKNNNRLTSRCKECHYIYHRKRSHDYIDNFNINDWYDTLEYWTDRDGNVRCCYCDKITYNPEMEHIIPFSKGGMFTKENIIPSCMTCNRKKSDKSLDEFYEINNNFKYKSYIKIIDYIEKYKRQGINVK